MARITVEDCLEKVDNRFSLVHLAARRVRQIKKGETPLVKCKNREVVTALREIASGEITADSLRAIDNVRNKQIELQPPASAETSTASGLSDLPAAISEEMNTMIPDLSLSEHPEEDQESGSAEEQEDAD
ncbi:MAG: DNA-directed RNA polymerase subunit omega [Deltaproteobacteria bacterium]|nr:DNA-directed RNA polymerase subunit omega [Deltaproteobacteria bacterium]